VANEIDDMVANARDDVFRLMDDGELSNRIPYAHRRPDEEGWDEKGHEQLAADALQLLTEKLYVEKDLDIDQKAYINLVIIKQKIAAVQARQKAKEGQRKSNAKYGVSPCDETTDLEVLEQKVREIVIDGLRWMGSDVQDIAYGLQRLIIGAQIVDQKIPDVDQIKDQIEEIEECQSCTMLSFEVA